MDTQSKRADTVLSWFPKDEIHSQKIRGLVEEFQEEGKRLSRQYRHAFRDDMAEGFYRYGKKPEGILQDMWDLENEWINSVTSQLETMRSSLSDMVMEKLPQELRDMIYECYLSALHIPPEPMVMDRPNNRGLLRDEFQSGIELSESQDGIFSLLAPHFVEELAVYWYKHTHLHIDFRSLRNFLEDEIGILGHIDGQITVSPFLHLRRLTVIVRSLGASWYPDELEQKRQYRKAFRQLRTLLAPGSIKHKSGFFLGVILVAYHMAESSLETSLRELAPVMYALKDQGFVLKITARCEGDDDKLPGPSIHFWDSPTRDTSHSYEVDREEWIKKSTQILEQYTPAEKAATMRVWHDLGYIPGRSSGDRTPKKGHENDHLD